MIAFPEIVIGWNWRRSTGKGISLHVWDLFALNRNELHLQCTIALFILLSMSYNQMFHKHHRPLLSIPNVFRDSALYCYSQFQRVLRQPATHTHWTKLLLRMEEWLEIMRRIEISRKYLTIHNEHGKSCTNNMVGLCGCLGWGHPWWGWMEVEVVVVMMMEAGHEHQRQGLRRTAASQG